MDLHVALQAPLIQETLATLLALVRTFLLVDALVSFECGLVGKALSTHTSMQSLFFVSQKVPVEVGHTAERQVTMGAFVRTFRLVSVLPVGLKVPHQGRLPGKCPATLGTQVFPILHMGALMFSMSS